MRFDLARMARCLSHFDNPHDAFPAIHVAGTNGKGSVVALISRTLIDAGHRVGVYTSPHLVRMTERFRVNDREISRRDLDRLLRRVQRVFPDFTQFELLSAVAFLWFAEQKIDIAVVEVGLGGRLDATNVMRRVLVSVITNIDLDHTEWLGNTIEKIAFEKAGIVKPFVPVVTATTGSARRVIESVARSKQATVIRARPLRAKLKLVGPHQQQNAAVARAALEQLSGTRFAVTPARLQESFARATWPGRCERIGRVMLDGAHNLAGCRALAAALKEQRWTPAALVFGVMKDKDVRGMARALAPLVDECFTVPVPSERAADPKAVAALKEWRGKATALSSIDEGIARLKAARTQRGVVAGSLYLVGAVRARLTKEKRWV
jgi:dihydrofolate synthase/folylpolyglutamate synthase